MIFFFLQKIDQNTVSHDQIRQDRERPSHFQKDVEKGVKRHGNDETFDHFFFRKQRRRFQMHDSVKGTQNRVSILNDLLLKNGFGEMGNPIIISKNSREKDVGKGGKDRSENE